MCKSNDSNVVPISKAVFIGVDMGIGDTGRVTHVDQSNNRVTHIDRGNSHITHVHRPRQAGKTTEFRVHALIQASDRVQQLVNDGIFFDESQEAVANIVQALNDLEAATHSLKAQGW